MLSFRQYISKIITEQFLVEEQNVHMTHVEDLVLIDGSKGATQAIAFLNDLLSMLSGNSKSSVTATVKWDGAPAIFAGIDPSDNKFFVAKKGLFNKTPLVYKTSQDIAADSKMSPDLANKMNIALDEFKKLGIKSGVIQGDIMFTNDTLKKEDIKGETYITFHPNTIVYAIPYDSDLGQQIRKAKIGVVWHTKYTGSSFESMQAEFGRPISETLKKVPSVWMDDATYKDYSGVATFTANESKQVKALLSKANQLLAKLKILDNISSDTELTTLIQTFNNSIIRAGEKVADPINHVAMLIQWIKNRYEGLIASKKQEATKKKFQDECDKIVKKLEDNKQQVILMYQFINNLVDIKQLIIAKMNQASHINTFIKDASGFHVTGVEGFVAIDHLTGNAVKIVDRMEFSKNNFSSEIIKGWQKS